MIPTSHMKVYLGWGCFALKIPVMSLQTSECDPTFSPSI